MKSDKYLQAVSLIELLVVLVIIGIMSLVAYPQYKSYLISSRRHAAIQELHKYQQLAENYVIENNAAPPTNWSSVPSQTEDGAYQLSFTNTGGENYTITATANSFATSGYSQGSDKEDGTDCSVLFITNKLDSISPPQCR